MRSIKPGRGPSAISAIGSVVGILFGIFWTAIAFAITKDAPIPIVHFAFPAFGVIFILIGVVSLVYNITNTVSPNRFSTFDVTTDAEEPDPLNRRFGNPGNDAVASPSPHVRSTNSPRKFPGEFCPFCGERVTDEMDFCPKCGKDI